MEVHKEIYTNLFVYQSFHLNEKKKSRKNVKIFSFTYNFINHIHSFYKIM